LRSLATQFDPALLPKSVSALPLLLRTSQIAQQLGLAVPTVNNTLARAYSKLGITGRTQLRPLLESTTSPSNDR
jgi:Bacterial regulatory proteins, luxR family